MPKLAKRMTAMTAKVPPEGKPLPVGEAVAILKTFNTTKFDQTVEIVMRLGIDPKQADQLARGSIVLPNGIAGSDDPLLSARSAAYAQSFTRRIGEPRSPSALSPSEIGK